MLLLFLFSALAFADEPESLGTINVHDQAPVRPAPTDQAELDGESIELPRNQETSLPQLLSTRSTALTPRTVGDSEQNPQFLVRGQDPSQTRYFLEGVPLTDAEYNSANLALLPLEMLGKVDVYPDGVPVFLAEDGLGGAIHFRLRDPESDAKKSRAALRVGSYQSMRAYAEHDFVTPYPWRVHVDYAQAKEDFVYFDDHGTPFNANDDSYQRRANNAYCGATLLPYARLWQTASQSLSLFSLSAYRETEIPGPVNYPLQAKLSEAFETAGLSHLADWSRAWSSEEILYLRWNQQTLRNAAPLPSYPPANSNDLALGTRARAIYKPREHWQYQFLAGVTGEKFAVTALSGGSQEQSRVQIPLGVVAEWSPSAAFALRPAVLGHHYRYQAAAGPQSYWLLSPRLGTQGLFSRNLGWHFSAGEYYRAPTLYEIYGAPNSVSPSRDLTYERAWKLDGGLDARVSNFARFVSELRGFYAYSLSRASNLIAYVQNSQQTRIATNVGESLIQTHELGVEARAPFALRVKSGLALLNTRNLSDIPSQYDQRLPLRPDYRWQAEVAYETPRFSAGYTYTLDGPVYADLTNTQRLDSISDHGLWANYATDSLGSFTFEVRNLADTVVTGATVGGLAVTDNTTGYMGYPAPGRRVYLTWKYEL